MRFVTLNLDAGDAATLRRAVEGALAACPCQEEPRPAPCHGCAALEAIRDELARMLAPRIGRPATAAGEDRVVGWEGTASRGDAETGAGLRRRLYVVPPVTADA